LNASFVSRQVSGVTVIDISGRVTLGDPAEGLREAVETALKEGATRILLNLAAVNYVDSSGIAALLFSLRTAKEQGASLKLLNLSRRIQDLLKLTGVLPLFECLGDEAAAVSSFV
jgi:anti-sigma B factor antagonist